MASEGTFTPGPWVASQATNSFYERFESYWLVRNRDGSVGVADLFGEVFGRKGEDGEDGEVGEDLLIPNTECEANARLISAAPIGWDLANAVLAMANVVKMPDNIVRTAAEFVRKATGRDT